MFEMFKLSKNESVHACLIFSLLLVDQIQYLEVDLAISADVVLSQHESCVLHHQFPSSNSKATKKILFLRRLFFTCYRYGNKKKKIRINGKSN